MGYFQKSLFKAPEAPRKSRSRKPTMESTEVKINNFRTETAKK